MCALLLSAAVVVGGGGGGVAVGGRSSRRSAAAARKKEFSGPLPAGTAVVVYTGIGIHCWFDHHPDTAAVPNLSELQKLFPGTS